MSKRKSVQRRKVRNQKIEKLFVLIILLVFGFVMGGKAYMYHQAHRCFIDNQNCIYVGYCETFKVTRTKLPRSVKVTYYFYLDNGAVLSVPQFILERAGIDTSELNMLFTDRLEFTYCPYSTFAGTHWIVSISKGDMLILPESVTQDDFIRSTKVYGIFSGLTLCPAILIIIIPKIFSFYRWARERRKARLRKKRKQLRENQEPM